MFATLGRIIDIVSRHSGVRPERLSATSAIDRDIRIRGDDVTELIEALVEKFGDQVWQWPWQRFAELSEPSALAFPYFVWRLLTPPIGGRLFDPSPFERLELGHIAQCIEAGHWSEP